jgi:peptidoglycan/LPS O-acetylase OafA/YrhL
LTWAFDPNRSTREFFVHRIARIYPVHLICLLICIAAFSVNRWTLAGYIGTRIGTLANVFLVHDWVPGHPEIRQAWNGVSWSLSAEFFFYVFAPFLIRRSQRASSTSLINLSIALFLTHLAAGVLAVHAGSATVEDFMIFHPVPLFPEFIYGIVAACLVQRGLRVMPNTLVKIGSFLPLLLYCYVTPTGRNAMLMMDLAVPPFLILIVAISVDDIELGPSKTLTSRVLQRIGDASYSLYMIHAILLGAAAIAMHQFGLDTHPTSLVIAYSLMTIPVAILFYKWVELPTRIFMLRTFSRPQRQIEALPAAVR